jgi:hypothetical protein
MYPKRQVTERRRLLTRNVADRVGAQAFKVLLVVHLLLYIAPDFIILRYSTLMLCGLVGGDCQPRVFSACGAYLHLRH